MDEWKLQETANKWAERCDYWQRISDKRPNKRKRRQRETRGLILTGHGISISIHRGTLLIQDGNTHYPAAKRLFRFFKGDLTLPPRIVLIDGSGNLTLDALDWLAEQNVDLIRLKWDGRIMSASTASGYSADSKKVAWQIAAQASEQRRVAFAVPLITNKIKATLFNLQNLLPPSLPREKAIDTAKAALSDLISKPPTKISKLLAIEGNVAQGYFYAWRALEIKWKATSQYPIPDEWRRYFSRSSLRGSVRIKNKNATHPVNAMLNYAYTALESSTRIQAIADGYDPSIGIMHDHAKPDRHSFVFDLMEPQRPIFDRAVLKLISEETFSGTDFILQRDGICRLNPGLAATLVSMAPKII